MEQAPDAAGKEFVVDEHDDRGKQQLQQADRQMVPLKEGGKGKPQHGMSHGDIHQHQQKAKRTGEPTLQHRRFPVAQRLLVRGGRGGLFLPFARRISRKATMAIFIVT